MGQRSVKVALLVSSRTNVTARRHKYAHMQKGMRNTHLHTINPDGDTVEGSYFTAEMLRWSQKFNLFSAAGALRLT